MQPVRNVAVSLDGYFAVPPLRLDDACESDELGRALHACAVPPGLIVILTAYPGLPFLRQAQDRLWAKLVPLLRSWAVAT